MKLTGIYAPMRIVGIQQCTTLDKVHVTLAQMWHDWQEHKASRLPSFTLTVYCVYQYFDDAPDDVLITIGRIVSQNLPLPQFAQETTLPEMAFMCFDVPDMTTQGLLNTWQQIEDDDRLNRIFHTDFETHTLNGNPKIYVSIQVAEKE